MQGHIASIKPQQSGQTQNRVGAPQLPGCRLQVAPDRQDAVGTDQAVDLPPERDESDGIDESDSTREQSTYDCR